MDVEAHTRTSTGLAPPRAQAWELARYRAYQARPAGHAIGENVGQIVPFLALIGANATSTTDISNPQPS